MAFTARLERMRAPPGCLLNLQSERKLPFSAIVQRIFQKADSDTSDFGGAAHALSRVSSAVRNAKAAWTDGSVIALIVTTESTNVVIRHL